MNLFKQGRNILIVFIICIALLPTSVFAAEIDEVREILDRYYVDEIPQEVLNKATIEEILNDLDPYTNFFTAEEFEEFIGSINMNFTGIGIAVEEHKDGVLVTNPLERSPAKAAGLKAGDIIIEADGKSLKGLPLEKATGIVRGPEGTKVKIKVYRSETGETLTFNVTRQAIQLPTVYYEKLGGNVGYVQLYSFNSQSADQIQHAMRELDGVDGWIFDIRNNGGGELTAAQHVAGFFPKVKDLILIEDASKIKESEPALEKYKKFNGDVNLLINEYSASASEILAGALKDYDAVKLYGQTTYGKGLAQTLVPLSEGDYLKFTYARFYTPKGNTINEVGVVPHVETEKGEELFVAHKDLIIKGAKNVTQINLDDQPLNSVLALDLKTPYLASKLEAEAKLFELGGEEREIDIKAVGLDKFAISSVKPLDPNEKYMLFINDGTNRFSIEFKTTKSSASVPRVEEFVDVKQTAFYADPVLALKNEGIINGISAREYAPEHELTRKDTAVLLAKALKLDIEGQSGATGFADVPSSAYFAKAVAAVKQAGIFNGKSANNFGADDVLTRGEMAAVLSRAFMLSDASGTSPFNDINNSPFKGDILKVYEAGISNGTSKVSFSPQRKLTRGEIATFLYRAMVLKGAEGLSVEEVK